MKEINWAASKKEVALIQQIVDRVMKICAKGGIRYPRRLKGRLECLDLQGIQR